MDIKKNFYFTFGSDEGYPRECRNGYVKVIATDEREAFAIFRTAYPDRHAGCLNCAFYYTQRQWDEFVGAHYIGIAPAAVLSLPARRAVV